MPDDFHLQEDGGKSEKILIEGQFILENEEDDGGFAIIEDGIRKIKIRKTFSENGKAITEVYGEVYEDERFNTYQSLNASEIKSLVQTLGLRPTSTKAQNIDIISAHLNETDYAKSLGLRAVNFPDLEPYLPILELVLSTDYKDPTGQIQGIIQSSLQSKLRQLENPDHPLYGSARALQEWAEMEASTQSSEIPEYLRSGLPKIKNVRVGTRVELSRLVTVNNVALDIGRGLQPLSSYGEGTRKKIWMGLIDWQQSSVKADSIRKSVIRVYDEPDINLDYKAEKRLFDSITSSSRDVNSKVQNIVCTHSVTLIDRAPPESICLIKILENDGRDIFHLDRMTEESPEERIRSFFSNVGGQLNLRNTELLYEKGYLVFEGETEGELLPKLYYTLHGKTLAEDGIVPLNLHSCSNWRTTLEFLGYSRKEMTIILLDNDASFPESSARVNLEALKEMGFSEGMFFVGKKELEDAFSDEIIARAMNLRFPREDGDIWREAHIALARNNVLDDKPKFSEDLKNWVRTYVEPRYRSAVRKVTIGAALGEACRPTDIPIEIVQAFQAIRQRAGIA